MNLTRSEFVDLVIKESKNQKWHIANYIVDGEMVRIKQFAKWIQVMEVGGIKDGIADQKTQKSLRERVNEFLDKCLT